MVRTGLRTVFLGAAIFICAGLAFGAVDQIVAVVNNEVITQRDIDEFAKLMYLQHADESQDKKALEQEMQKWRDEALERIISERLMVQEAKKEKVTVGDELIEARLGGVRNEFATSKQFEATLAAEGLTVNDLRRKISEQLLIQKIMEIKVRNKIFVSPKEVTEYYQQYKAQIMRPEEAVVDSIFISVDDSESIARKKANDALKELRAGGEFSQVAKKYSYAPSIGRLSKGELKQDIEEAIFKLKKDEYSPVIKTENGFYIFKLIDILPARQLELEEAKEQITQIIFVRKFDEQFSRWMSELKDKAYINVK